jgi:hypothetical protein
MAKQTVFHSKIAGLTLIRQHKLEAPLPTGGWQTTQRTVEYRFQPVPSPNGNENGFIGVLVVKDGQDKLSTDSEAWLRDGEEVGVVRDASAALMANRAYGIDFWLEGHVPGTLYPRPQDFRADLTAASVSLDEERLVEMLKQERGSHGRDDLIREAEIALLAVREHLAAMAAQQAEEEAKAAKAPKAKAAA